MGPVYPAQYRVTRAPLWSQAWGGSLRESAWWLGLSPRGSGHVLLEGWWIYSLLYQKYFGMKTFILQSFENILETAISSLLKASKNTNKQ